MVCPNCGSGNVKESTIRESFDYLTVRNAYEATFPAMECGDCKFGWRDHRSEEAIEKAMYDWLNWEPPFGQADANSLLAEAEYYDAKARGEG